MCRPGGRKSTLPKPGERVLIRNTWLHSGRPTQPGSQTICKQDRLRRQPSRAKLLQLPSKSRKLGSYLLGLCLRERSKGVPGAPAWPHLQAARPGAAPGAPTGGQAVGVGNSTGSNHPALFTNYTCVLCCLSPDFPPVVDGTAVHSVPPPDVPESPPPLSAPPSLAPSPSQRPLDCVLPEPRSHLTSVRLTAFMPSDFFSGARAAFSRQPSPTFVRHTVAELQSDPNSGPTTLHMTAAPPRVQPTSLGLRGSVPLHPHPAGCPASAPPPGATQASPGPEHAHNKPSERETKDITPFTTALRPRKTIIGKLRQLSSQESRRPCHRV